MGSKVISGFPAMPPQRSRAARLACCVAAIILRVSAAHAGVIGLAAAPERECLLHVDIGPSHASYQMIYQIAWTSAKLHYADKQISDISSCI